MTLKELMLKNGIEEAKADAVISGMAGEKIFLAGEENLDVRYGKLKEESNSLKEQLAAATKALDDLKKSTEGNADLQGKLDAAQKEIETLKASASAAAVKSAATLALTKAGAKDIDYALYKLGVDKMTAGEDGKIDGLDEKINAFKTANPLQFKAAEPEKVLPNGPAPTNNPAPTPKAKVMTYSDMVKMKESDPAAFDKL